MDMIENFNEYYCFNSFYDEEKLSRNDPKILSLLSQSKKEKLKLFTRIKRRIGENYATFKRHNDVYFEVFRIQCLLLSPFLKKDMFNSLTEKLIKLEKERLPIDDICKMLENFPITKREYHEFYSEKMREIKFFYKIEECSVCGSFFYEGKSSSSLCVDCSKICMNCSLHTHSCDCGNFEKCCESLEFCECEECGVCKNNIYCDC